MLTTIPPNADPKRRYDIKETCKLLGISNKTLRKWTRELKIHAVTHPADGRLYYGGQEINRFWNQTI